MSRWELIVRRREEQVNSAGRVRTVGTYRVLHDGKEVRALVGATAEAPGPGDNGPAAKEKKCIAAGTYTLMTTDGPTYFTHGYRPDKRIGKGMPGLELLDTGARSDILIHPGKNAFLSSIGCINLCTRLPDASERIDYPGSRQRVIDVIDDLAAYLGAAFPAKNGRPIPNAYVTVIDQP